MKHMDYKGEKFTHQFLWGVDGIEVEMVDYPEQWRIDKLVHLLTEAPFEFPDLTFADFSPNDLRQYSEDVFSGKKGFIGNFMEGIAFTFSLKNVTRSFTHQHVRHRIGHCFVQQGGRNNDFRHQPIRVPLSYPMEQSTYESFIKAKMDYAKDIDNGIPVQDARFKLPIGICTHIFWMCNFRSLDAFMRQRMCNNFHWEMNYVAKLVKVAVMEKLPMLANKLAPQCEHLEKCIYKDDLFTPCGKFPVVGKRESMYTQADALWEVPPGYQQMSGVDEKSLFLKRRTAQMRD